MDLLLYLAKPSTNIDHFAPGEKFKVKGQMVQAGEHRQTNGWTDATKCIISPALRSITINRRISRWTLCEYINVGVYVETQFSDLVIYLIRPFKMD